MTKQSSKPFTVVAAVDYGELSALVLTEAVAAARAHERSHVHVVHVVHPLHPAGANAMAPHVAPLDSETTAHAAEELRKYVEKILAAPPGDRPDDGKPLALGLTTHIRAPYAAAAIAQLASDSEADLVVVGTHGRRGFARLVMGSVAEGVVRLAPCAVLVVRPRGLAPDVPKIEPPCPRCLETRAATDGKEFWCVQHREHHDRRHTYHFDRVRSGHQSGLLFPMAK
jgi:nucleotide-binding universal stress UspA family protein